MKINFRNLLLLYIFGTFVLALMSLSEYNSGVMIGVSFLIGITWGPVTGLRVMEVVDVKTK